MPNRDEYPICPRCGSPVVGAMMTSGAVVVDLVGRGMRDTFYHPSAVSVYCINAGCNWDYPLAELKNPPPEK